MRTNSHRRMSSAKGSVWLGEPMWQQFHTTSERGHCEDMFGNDVVVCGTVEIPFRRAEFEINRHSSISGRLAFAVPIVADRPLQNAHEVQGSIVVIDRGNSSFDTKLHHAINAGASAVIFVNFSDEPFAATGVGEHQGVCLPVACLRRSDSGLLIRGQHVAILFKVAQRIRCDACRVA